MVDVMRLESNLYESFNRVKSDVIRLNDEMHKLSLAMKNLVEDKDKNGKKIIILTTKVADLDNALKHNKPVIRQIIQKAPAPKIRTKTVVVEKIKKVNGKHRSKTYLASKSGKKFHIKECIFAKNIKPKSLVKMKSKNAMLNKGYKPCVCVQK